MSLRYGDLLGELPTKVRVLVWPMHQLKRQCTSPRLGKLGSQAIPARLSFAEDALRVQSLPEGTSSSVTDLFKVLFLRLIYSFCPLQHTQRL